ncbi:class I SAM-dependent methyltransferase [Solibacillus sp. CAU 1738]|uniref:class I SAM-dependent methyltransferase n=1 Tax=Solibacillus sp. CAU 1738 TaxID=3140363 RepID=UPI003260D4D8
MKPTNKFTGKAQHYEAGRPSYAQALLDSVYTNYGLTSQSVIADIGSGTGKLTKQLLQRGSRVIAVEPNDDMRNTAQQELQQYTTLQIVKGSDAATTLPNESVDAITVAQAFHWFDPTAFQKECARILKPKGRVFLIWNMRDEKAAINKETYAIFKKYCPDFYGFSGGIQQEDASIATFFNNNFVVEKYPNPLYFTKETFLQRCLSGSYSLKKGDPQFEAYINELTGLFEKFAINDVVEVSNDSVAYIGTPF